MRFGSSERGLFERIVGKVILADRMLDAATFQLRGDKDELAELEAYGVFSLNDRLISGLKKRYDLNRRSRFYRFASEDAQRRNDLAWNYIGFILKQNLDYSEIILD